MPFNRTLRTTQCQQQWTLWTRILPCLSSTTVLDRYTKPASCYDNLFDVTSLGQQQDDIQPIIADLPKERLPSSINFPFRTIGVDYLGLFFIKTPCAEERCIHLPRHKASTSETEHRRINLMYTKIHLPKRAASLHQIRQRNYLHLCQ